MSRLRLLRLVSGDRLRELAEHVNIDVLRQIADPAVILRRFSELRGHLLAWAELIGPSTVGGDPMADWQSMVGKNTPLGKKFHRELVIDMMDNMTGQRIQYAVKEPQDEFAAHKDEIRKVAHEKLDLLLDKMFG